MKIQSQLRSFSVNLTLLQPPLSGPYVAAFQTAFGSLIALQQQQIWVQFLQDNNLTTTAPANDLTTQQLFTSFVDAHTPLPPTAGFYATALQSFFGGLNIVQQQQIWAQFLKNNNLTATPPETDNFKKLFISYGTSILSGIQGQNVQSPEEMKKRLIMASTMESLLAMLNSLQDTIGVESRNLIYYGNFQQEYTQMMARVPTYTGQPDDTVHVPATVDANTDYTQFTLGYNKLSISDIANWWATNSLTATNPQPFVINSTATVVPAFGPVGAPAQPLFSITFTPQSGTTPGSISWSQTDPNFGGTLNGGTFTIPLQPAATTFPNTGVQSQLQAATASYVTQFQTAFASAWNTGGNTGTLNQSLLQTLTNVNPANLTALNAISPANPGEQTPKSVPDTSTNSAMQIAWRFGYVLPPYLPHSDSSGNITPQGSLSDQQARLRGEINGKLQAVLENIRSRRKVIQNLAKDLQTNLDSSRTNITNQSDLLTSTLQSITDLIKAIFRK